MAGRNYRLETTCDCGSVFYTRYARSMHRQLGHKVLSMIKVSPLMMNPKRGKDINPELKREAGLKFRSRSKINLDVIKCQTLMTP